MPHVTQQASLFDEPQSLPEGLTYQTDFLSAAEERQLLGEIAPLPLREAKFREFFAKRRVAHFHEEQQAPDGQDGGDGADALASGPLPPFLVALRGKVGAWLGMPPAAFVHALVSEYRIGTPIGWHRDKPAYGIVVGISLAGFGRMRFRPYAAQDAKHTRVLDVASRSIYVMRDAVRWQWQHSMLPTRELRYSITMRTAAQIDRPRLD